MEATQDTTVVEANPFIKILPHQVTCTPENQNSKKIEKLCTLLIDDLANHREEHKFERTLIFCNSTKSCRVATVALLSKRIHNWIMTDDILEDKQTFAIQMQKFIDGEERIGACTLETLERAEFPLVKHYIVLEMPSKLSRLNKHIKLLEEKAEQKQRPIRIDFITTNLSPVNEIKALLMELDSRGCTLPQWLLEGVISHLPQNQLLASKEKQVLNANVAHQHESPNNSLRLSEMQSALSHITVEGKNSTEDRQMSVNDQKEPSSSTSTDRVRAQVTEPAEVMKPTSMRPKSTTPERKQAEVEKNGGFIVTEACFNYDDDDDYEDYDHNSEDYNYEQEYEYESYEF